MAKVLIVDDDAVYREIIKDTLEQKGYEVITAEDGEKGLQAAKEHAPGVILLDVMMPNQHGLSAIKQMKEDEAVKGIPVFLSSNFSSVKDLADDFGAAGFILKSETSRQEVLQKVGDVLQTSK